MGWNDHVDWEAEQIEEIRKDKRETAQIMRENGFDEETIKSDVWDTVDAECQGTCQGWLTQEEHDSGLDMCWGCKYESMD